MSPHAGHVTGLSEALRWLWHGKWFVECWLATCRAWHGLMDRQACTNVFAQRPFIPNAHTAGESRTAGLWCTAERANGGN